MRRPPYSRPALTFGPGPITPAVRALIAINVVVYLVLALGPSGLSNRAIELFGLRPASVVGGQAWQVVTYLFLHAPHAITHIVFNMLALWMFGVDLERRWGTTFFTKYYFVCGVGAGLCTIAASFLPFDAAAVAYTTWTIGASGAIYGLLLAWALLFPDRTVLFIVFPMRARMFVTLVGAIAFFSALEDSGGAVANVAHLGGLLVGWLYLRGPRDLQMAFKYRLTKWRMERMRRRFNVHEGGRGPWDRRVH